MSHPKFPPEFELIDDHAIIWDDRLGSIIYKMGFFGKPLGLRKAKPGNLNRPLVLSLFEALYLLKNRVILVYLGDKKITGSELIEYANQHYEEFHKKYKVYEYLRKLGYVVRPGMKFGSDFVLYTKGPGFDHSKWVVHVEKDDKQLKAIEIVRAGRLAASVRKKYLISTLDSKEPIFYSFERVKI